MTMTTIINSAAAAAIVRQHLTGQHQRTEGAAITGLRGPLGDTITATVFSSGASLAAHIEARLTVTEFNRGDTDANLGIAIAPSGLDGIDHGDAEAWNVHMTLPTLLRLLGQDPTHNTEEGTAP